MRPACGSSSGTAPSRKQAEAALRRAHAELEQQVQERTAALMHTNVELRAEIAERRRAEAALAAGTRFLKAQAEVARNSTLVCINAAVRSWTCCSSSAWARRSAASACLRAVMSTTVP